MENRRFLIGRRNGLDKKTIIETVDKLRKELNLESPVNLDKFFEYFSNLSIEYESAINEDEVIGNSFIYKDKEHYILSVRWKKEDETEKERWTIARELGHLFLGHVDRHEILYRGGANKLVHEANEFAAELLMPREEFTKQVNLHLDSDMRCHIVEVAKKFGVIHTAALTRGKIMGLFEW